MRRFMKFSHGLALASVIAAPQIACSKDEPKPPVAADVVAEVPKAPPVEEKPKTPEPEVKPPEPAAAPPSGMNLGSLATLPEDIVAVGGVASVDKLIAAFTAQAKEIPGVEVPSDPLKMALEGLKAQLGVDLAWLDPEAPVNIAVPNPKKYTDGFIVLLPVKQVASLDLSKLPGAVSDTEGHDGKLDFQGRTLYLDEIEGGSNRGTPPRRLIITSHHSLVRELEPFIQELGRWIPGESIVLDTSVENLTRIFGAELGDAKKSLGDMATMLGDAQQAQTIAQAAELGFAFAEGTTRMSVGLDLATDFPRLGFSFTGKPDSGVAKFAAQTNGRKVSFASAIPDDAWFAMGYDIDGLGYLRNAESSLNQLFATPNPFTSAFSEDDKKELTARLQKLTELQGTQSVTWFRVDGAHPFVFESISDAKDGDAAVNATLDFADLLYRKGWSLLRDQLTKGGQLSASEAPENLDFRGFVKVAGKMASAIGISMDVKESATKNGGKGVGFEFSVSPDKLPPDEELKAALGLFGTQLGIGVASEGKLVSFAFSADAAARAAALLDKGIPASSNDPWLTAASNKAMFAMLRPARILKALTVLPELADKKAFVDGFPDEPLVFSGTSDGQTLSFEIAVSSKQIKALATLN